MIAEYALEPEMVANWCTDRYKCQFFKNSFGSAQGRLVSRYPKKWAKKVWDAYVGSSEMDKKRLEELLLRLQETLIKRKDFFWDDAATWVDNAVKEHARHPFSVILARNNPGNRSELLEEDAISDTPCRGWDKPHGTTVSRNASEMASAVHQMLSCCRWVKFIDPYFVQAKPGHKRSLSAFLNILAAKRPVGPPETIEMHTSGDGATTDHLREFYEKSIPVGLRVILYRWQQRPGGQNLHNRYILTDLGGVSFQHGLDAGRKGETDDITRLDPDQHVFHCKQYDAAAQAFDQAADPLVITGTSNEKV